MLVIPPPKYRRRRRIKPEAAAPSPPAAPVTVVSVEAFEGGFLLWSFSDDVVRFPPDNIPELRAAANFGPGWISPSDCELVGDNQINAHYDGQDFVAEGFSWEVLTLPVGVSFVGGGTLVVPEVG